MFYLDGRDGAKYSSSSNNEEIFGWWLSDRMVVPKSYHVKNHSRGSSASIMSYIDSDDSSTCSFARDVSRQEPDSGICEIELQSFTRDDLDTDSIERNAKEVDGSPSEGCDDKEDLVSAVCYTPERLIQSQEYRILVPSPRRFTKTRFTLENESRERRYRRKWLSLLVDSKPIDVKIRAVSSPISGRRWVTDDFNTLVKSNDDPLIDGDCDVRSTKTADSSLISCNKLNFIWDNYDGTLTRRSSLEDTSGIQSYDWSLETQGDARNTPICLHDELAIASKNHAANFANNGDISMNKAASTFEPFQNNGQTRVLPKEEDRFYDSTSSHDQLIRLALAIETDVEAPVIPDPNNWVHCLRDRIERLQLANREIHGDVCDLHTNFQCDEKKAINLLSGTTKLLEEVHDLRYFDDLVKLLEGELERISRRNWPFILGHSKPHEEINLII